MEEEYGLIHFLAKKIGCPEAGLRLLISLFLGYPMAFIYRHYFYFQPPNLQHCYFIFCGMFTCFFNYGWDVKHSFIAISVTYLVLKYLGGNIYSLLIVFIYTMLHLLIGYWTTATSKYDIKWTMPQCVLTLRLIGLAFNVYDGKQPKDSLSEENKKTALDKMPSAFEVFAHSYFPACFLVGPQVSIKRYTNFVNHELQKEETDRQSHFRRGRQLLPDSVTPGLIRLGIGLIYLTIYQVTYIYVNDDFIVSKHYKSMNFIKKFLLLGLWSRITLYKYISCWLITEGCCIVMGLTYNGKDSKGQSKWDGCSNVKLRVFENTTKMNHYIESFNINTNSWVAQYIFKRLKFLNNKTLSHIGTLFFLAVWHGFHSGYYATFFFEYLIITAEKIVSTSLRNRMGFLKKRYIYPFLYVILRIYTFVIMGYAMAPFILLKHPKYLPVYSQFYYSVHIICIVIIMLNPFLKSSRDRAQSVAMDFVPSQPPPTPASKKTHKLKKRN